MSALERAIADSINKSSYNGVELLHIEDYKKYSLKDVVLFARNIRDQDSFDPISDQEARLLYQTCFELDLDHTFLFAGHTIIGFKLGVQNEIITVKTQSIDDIDNLKLNLEQESTVIKQYHLQDNVFIQTVEKEMLESIHLIFYDIPSNEELQEQVDFCTSLSFPFYFDDYQDEFMTTDGKTVDDFINEIKSTGIYKSKKRLHRSNLDFVDYFWLFLLGLRNEMQLVDAINAIFIQLEQGMKVKLNENVDFARLIGEYLENRDASVFEVYLQQPNMIISDVGRAVLDREYAYITKEYPSHDRSTAQLVLFLDSYPFSLATKKRIVSNILNQNLNNAQIELNKFEKNTLDMIRGLEVHYSELHYGSSRVFVDYEKKVVQVLRKKYY
ncbi:hypothetical protein HDV06_001592 [Boothiomyces sp. JEL0866]|nr:hypothetical protein HDV06_001592 [Boothiomyces sp. JEL0866]